MKKIQISPSILSADFSQLGEEVRNLCKASADLIHIDIMDGHFVPNITIGPNVVKAIKKNSSVPLDIHLMIQNIEYFIPKFIDAGANIITLHMESNKFDPKFINHLKFTYPNLKFGLAISPSSPILYEIEDILKNIDLILIMTVTPGFAGQKFLKSQIDKIKQIRQLIKDKKLKVDVSVDGGIDKKTSKLCINAGANILVAGSYIFENSNQNYKSKIEELRNN